MSHDHSSPKTVSSTGLSLILPTLIFLMLLGAAWFYIGSSCNAKPTAAPAEKKVPAAH
jgi:hypothetical protein